MLSGNESACNAGYVLDLISYLGKILTEEGSGYTPNGTPVDPMNGDPGGLQNGVAKGQKPDFEKAKQQLVAWICNWLPFGQVVFHFMHRRQLVYSLHLLKDILDLIK